MSTWEKLPPYTGEVHQGCLCCPPVEAKAPMGMIIAVGFGDARVTRDGDTIFDENNAPETDEDYHSLQEFEDMAMLNPDCDWRVILHAPLRSREYQRHDVGTWVLIKSGEGFA